MDLQLIIIIVSIAAAVALFLFLFFFLYSKFRKKVIEQQEQIKMMKSDIRIVKAKYVQQIRLTSSRQLVSAQVMSKLGGVLKFNAPSFGYGGASGHGYSFDGNQFFKTDIELVDKLSSYLLTAQSNLNREIKKYNTFITRLRTILYAKMLRCKKLDYVEEYNFDKSLIIEDIDGQGV